MQAAFAEIFSVNGVQLLEFLNVFQVDLCVHYVLHGQAAGFHHCLDIFERLAHLRCKCVW